MTPSSRPLALVTGGSNGIGLELARELGHRGYDLVINGTDQGKLDRASPSSPPPEPT